MDGNSAIQGTLTRESPTPLYHQLKHIITQQIAEGVFKPGSAIPSERKLCELYDVSHITVRNALVELTREHVLFRVPGRGTFVSRELPKAKTQTLPVGVVIPETDETLSSSFVSDLLQGIKSVTTRDNLPLMLFTETESEYVTKACAREMRALILTDPQVKDTRIAMIAKSGVPFVVVGRCSGTDVHTVDTDNIWIGYIITRTLLGAGRRKIGLLNGPGAFTVSQDRLTGYRKALEEHGVPYDDGLVRYGSFSEASGHEQARELLEAGADAIACADDLVALGGEYARLARAQAIEAEIEAMD